MSPTTLPAYEAKAKPEPFCGYDKRVKAYGKPPTGYRWLKVGEKMPDGSIYANHHDEKWIRGSCIGHVVDSNYAFAAPITPELIPDDPSAAVALEVVSRNSKTVRFKIARQAAIIYKTGELFTAKNGLKIVRYNFPEFRCDLGFSYGRLYLRGTDSNKDNLILSCTPKRFEQIVAALAEYNASLVPKVEVPKPAPVSSEPPKYTGLKVCYNDDLANGIERAGPAPDGWRYLSVGETIKEDDWVLYSDQWRTANGFSHKLGGPVTAGFWPVIRRVEPCSPPKSPESIIAERDAEIAVLKAKVAEQEKSLAKIKAIVA